MRKIFLFALLVTASLLLSLNTFAADPVSRTISIFDLSGTVKMTKGTAKEFNAKKGVKLFEGYTLSLGEKSSASLKLDDDSLITVDQKSKISIARASKDKLSVSVLSGGIYVDANTQKEGNTLEVRAGNTALAVRGTKFIFESSHNGNVNVIMLEGEGDVNGDSLMPGYIMTVSLPEMGETLSYSITDLESLEDLSLFALEALLENSQLLTENGVFSEEGLNSLPNLIQEAEETLKEEEAFNQSIIDTEDPEKPSDTPSDDIANDDDFGSNYTPPAPNYIAQITYVKGSEGEKYYGSYENLNDAITAANALKQDTSITNVYLEFLESTVFSGAQSLDLYIIVYISSGKTLTISGDYIGPVPEMKSGEMGAALVFGTGINITFSSPSDPVRFKIGGVTQSDVNALLGKTFTWGGDGNGWISP